MLTGSCIHPGLVGALSLCGHGDKVLIADGNYPLASKTGDAEKIWLGLRPGLPTVTDVLEALQSVVNVEAAAVMEPEDGSTPEIFSEFEARLPGVPLKGLSRYDFYDACGQGAVRLAVATGEQRTFANLLVTIGVA